MKDLETGLKANILGIICNSCRLYKCCLLLRLSYLGRKSSSMQIKVLNSGTQEGNIVFGLLKLSRFGKQLPFQGRNPSIRILLGGLQGSNGALQGLKSAQTLS